LVKQYKEGRKVFMQMKVIHEIKAEDLRDLLYCFSSDALEYHGLEEFEYDELSYNMFLDYIESLANKKEVLQLLGN
jgi:hypothetical protein